MAWAMFLVLSGIGSIVSSVDTVDSGGANVPPGGVIAAMGLSFGQKVV